MPGGKQRFRDLGLRGLRRILKAGGRLPLDLAPTLPAPPKKGRGENGVFAAWACEVCEEFIGPEAISPWTWHLLFLHHLKKAGYPFRANDLSLEVWLLLGLVQREVEAAGGGKIAEKQV